MIRNIVAAVCIFAGMFAAGCDSSTQSIAATDSKAKKADPVQVVAARQQTVSRSIEVTGDVVAANAVVIRASVDGPVAWCPWREGDSVKKGEKLVEIDRPVYREEVRGAEAALSVARARLAALAAGARKEEVAQASEIVKEYESCAEFSKTDMERTEQLVKSGAVPEENLEKSRMAYTKCETGLAAAREKHEMLKSGPVATDIDVQKALVREAEAKVDMARARLAECLVTAPFDGVVTRVDVRPGDLAAAKSPLLSLMEIDSIVVRFSVPEAHSHKLSGDTPVKVSMDALPGKEYGARIVRVYPEIDPRTRTRIVEARVEDSTNLVPGMFARLSLTMESSDAGVVVPDRALLTTSDGGNGQTVDELVGHYKEGHENREMEAGNATDEQ